jgi:quinol monooxygenase YgiN
MYGTIGHFHVKAGMEGQLLEALRGVGNLNLPGSVAAYCYRADESTQDYYIAVVFTSKEAYFAHAKHPEVAEIDDYLMTLLEREPEWHDGEVVYAMK